MITGQKWHPCYICGWDYPEGEMTKVQGQWICNATCLGEPGRNGEYFVPYPEV
jgi:hypothetical protein